MISIIIPTLNESKTIEVTLKNLISGLKNISHEIIISDGKSSDNTIEIAQKYAKVIVYSGTTRQNIAMGRNAGAKIANGDLLVFIDADVVMFDVEEFFKKAIKNFENNKKLAGLGSKIRVLPELETFSDKFFRTIHNSYNIFINNILHLGSGAGEFQMVRADVFRKIGGFNEKLIAGEDHDLFIRLSKVGRTYYDTHLTVYEKGRRAHAIGWPKLMSIWIINGLSVSLFKRSVSKEWKVIR